MSESLYFEHHIMNKKIVIAVLILSLQPLMQGCALGPDFLRPQSPAQDAPGFINAIEHETQAEAASIRWWENIDDPLLSGYINQLLAQNLSLKQASERMIQARENVTIQRAGFFPSLSGNASASRDFTPGQSGAGPISSFLPASRIFTDSFVAELNTSWEVDLFGRIKKSNEVARAGFQASAYDREALAHSLIADLLNRRIAIATDKRLVELARDNAQNRKILHDVTLQRYNLGSQSASISDVYLAENNFETVQADIHEFERLLAEESYHLDILLGQLPGTTDPNASEFPILPAPLDVPVCLPADLLDRRPDLKASELRLRAAHAEIGIAMADLYPTLDLSAGIGFRSGETRDLFTADQLAGSILSGLTAPIFAAGSLRSNLRIQKSEARELAAAYADEILNAMREVETALNAEEEIGKELGHLDRSLTALRRAEDLTFERYKNGIETLQNFLDIQQRRYTAEQTYILHQRDKWFVRVSLYLALGGDWLGAERNHPICQTYKDTQIEKIEKTFRPLSDSEKRSLEEAGL